MEISREQRAETPTQTSIRRSLLAIVFILTAQVFYFAQDIIMPIILGFLIALTLRPIVRWFEKRSIPAALTAIFLVPTLGLGIGVGAYMLSGPVSEMVESAPELGSELREKFDTYRDQFREIKKASDQVEDMANGANEGNAQEVVIQQPGLLTSAASNLASGVSTIFVAFILALLLLSTGTLFYEKVVAILPLLSEKKRAIRVIYDVERQVSRYLLTITMINMGLGAVIAFCLYLYGMPNAALWGTIATALNFLPFAGAIIGTGAIALMGIATFDSLAAGLAVPAIYFACTLIEGNFVTPWIVGRRLELNIVAVFMFVAIWAWLWGVAGALIAVPLLVVIKVLCDNFESMAAFGHFLSAHPTMNNDEDDAEDDN